MGCSSHASDQPGRNDNQKESPAGLLYRFEGAAMFIFLPEKETASRAREHLVDYERSEIIYLVIRGEALVIGALLRCPTKKGPPWTFVPVGSFFLFLTEIVHSLVIFFRYCS